MAWTSIVGVGLSAYLAQRRRLLSDLTHWQQNSARIQRAQLRELLRQASRAEIGRKHNFARIAELDDGAMLDAYRKELPLADWYLYRTQIARMREDAEPDVLWPGLVRDFAQTSGTTAGDKYIPVSEAMLASNRKASFDIFANAQRFGLPLSRLLGGKSLFLGGSTKFDTSPKGIRTGDLSGLVTRLIVWPITKIYLPGPEIALMSHWPSKLDAMAKLCVDQDVRMVSGVPSWAIVLFEKVISIAKERGRNVSTLRDVWPNFQLFVHGGVKYPPFEQKVKQVWSGSDTDIPNRLELYPASEGFVAIQDVKNDPGLRLNVDMGIFYEFVPLEDIDKPDARAFTCEQVEKGQKYVVCMSTCAGLWRYILGDVVVFETLPGDLEGKGGEGPCRLRIVGRHRHFMNAFGENLIGEHIENAVVSAARTVGLAVGEFTAAPVYPAEGRRAGMELVLELESFSSVSPETLGRFQHAFDESLKAQNVDYTTKRTDGVGMAPPTVSPVAVGTFHRWMEARGKLGGQHKCPRCSNGREIVDAVLATARSL
jgi:hypothetical protein